VIFELSDAISEHFIRLMLKKHLSWDRCFLDAKTTFLAKSVKKCINFEFFFHENFRKNSNFFQIFNFFTKIFAIQIFFQIFNFFMKIFAKIQFFFKFSKTKKFQKIKKFSKKNSKIQKIDSDQ
jgi:hypothetical protein